MTSAMPAVTVATLVSDKAPTVATESTPEEGVADSATDGADDPDDVEPC